MINKFSQDLQRFTTKFGLQTAVDTLDKEYLKEFMKFRAKHLQEELDELVDALENDDSYEFSIKFADDAVDAHIDLIYLAVGNLEWMGVDVDKAWTAVHEKNMQKQLGVNNRRPNQFGLPDMIKPEGWTPPSHQDNLGKFKIIFE